MALFLTVPGKHEKLSAAKGRGTPLRTQQVLEKIFMAKEIYLIIGLGNPGEKYAHTRHNAGFDVMERLEKHYGVRLRKKLFMKGMTAETTDGDRKIVLCEPLTYMNKSGECVSQMIKRWGVPADRMLVIYDDIDLPPGKVRVRKSGGPGTHNGMRSIAESLGATDFPRIRVGTGDRPAGADLAEWVLGHCAPEEREKMDTAFDRAAEAARIWVEEGIDRAMQKGNG